MRPFAAALSEVEDNLRAVVRRRQGHEAEERRLHDALTESREQLEDVRMKHATLAVLCDTEKNVARPIQTLSGSQINANFMLPGLTQSWTKHVLNYSSPHLSCIKIFLHWQRKRCLRD